MSDGQSKAKARRRRWRLRAGIALALALSGVATVWIALPKLSLSFQRKGVEVHTVRRGPFVHDLVERGSLESASNVEIRCLVQTSVGGGSGRDSSISFTPSFRGADVRRSTLGTGSGRMGGGSGGAASSGMGGGSVTSVSRSSSGGGNSGYGGGSYSGGGGYGGGSYGGSSRGGGGGGGTMILELIAEGTYVQPGDVLCRLDSSALEAQLVQQQISCNASEAGLIRARNTYDTCVITKQEYLEGQYVQDKQAIESDIFVAEENVRRAQQYLEYSKHLRTREYITDLQVDVEQFSVAAAEKELTAAKLDLRVLEDYVKMRAVKQLDADIKTAETALRSQEHSHQLNLERLTLIEQQIAACTIKAPEAGQVVYVNDTDRSEGQEVIIEEGGTVRERQLLFRLPDPKRMQVKTKIDEARIGLVKPGQSVSIRLDAFPDRELKGTVERLSEYPAPTSFFSGGGTKEYEVLIRVDGAPEGLRPGLTAEVRIRAREEPRALQVPVAAILQQDGRNYCILHSSENDWRMREVELGATNDTMVIVESGVDEGDPVVLGANRYRGQFPLPASGSRQSVNAIASAG